MHAAKWELVFERGGHQVFLDRASMVLTGAFRRAHFRIEWPQDVPAAGVWPAYRSSLEVRRYDCLRRRAGVESLEVFAGPDLSGAPLQGVHNKNVKLEKIVPGTIGEAVMRAVCRATD